jgi:hypothetical protein
MRMVIPRFLRQTSSLTLLLIMRCNPTVRDRNRRPGKFTRSPCAFGYLPRVLQYIGRPLWERYCTTPVPRQCKVYAPIHMSMVSKPDIGLLCIPSRPKADNSVGGQRFATHPLFNLVVGMVLHLVARNPFATSPPARASLPITRSRLKGPSGGLLWGKIVL